MAVTSTREAAFMEPLDSRLDRLEALLISLVDQVQRLTDEVALPLHLQARTLRQLEQALDSARPTLPPPSAPFEAPVEERS